MNEMPATDWNDLAKLWQADGAGISIDEIEQHVRRERLQLLGVLIAEIAGLCVAAGAASWLYFFTPFTVLGAVIAIFGGVCTLLAVRMRREPAPSGARDLLHSLKESIAREDWIDGQLRLGRALNFVALFAIVMATSMQLLHFHAISSLGLAGAAVSSVYVVGVLVWNLVLTRRTKRRRARLEYINDRLKA
ncbi:MAG TPA: hypothetical protein VGO61_12905 [Steroidobacteraceae bacterium]|jgi:hypothetical protein|nr:hypothetical protein [Steroidobacteraceae bacterium]